MRCLLRRWLWLLLVMILSIKDQPVGGANNNIQGLRFNEVMQSNIDNFMFEYNFPDSWIELYNPTDVDINLKDYILGLDEDVNKGFRIIVDSIISAHGYRLIYADKQNWQLHTNFRLDMNGCSLYLFNPQKEIVDIVKLKKCIPNVAYGRVDETEDKWIFEKKPTPGFRNLGGGSDVILPDPVFSLGGGVYEAPINITVRMPDGDFPEDTKLYVTSNGDEPNRESPHGESFEFHINETTIVRAKLLSDSALENRSITNSYIFHHCEITMPVISVVTDSSFLYDKGIGILLGGDNDKTTNCYKNWRRPVNLEYYDSKTDNTFNQLCETKVSGNYSRAYPQKSMNYYANKRFGTKKFKGDFWDDKPVSKVKSFMMRNGGTTCLAGRFNDALTQRIFGYNLSNIDWQSYTPVVAYINGRYKGVYGMRERSDEDYVESNYGLDTESIEQHDQRAYFEIGARKGFLWEEFYDLYHRADVSYDEMTEMMDVDNFMETLIVELFSTNYDYPQNNISVWREKKQGGKWRWILKDLDYTGFVKSEKYNMFKYLFGDTDDESEEYKDAQSIPMMDECSLIYKVMMRFPEFRDKFIDRFSVYLGDFLKYSYTLPFLEEMNNQIRHEISETFKANSNMSTLENYDNSIMKMEDFWEKRPEVLYSQIAEYFNLGATVRMIIDPLGSTEVEMNDVKLKDSFFEGCYFLNRELHLSSDTSDREWSMTLSYTDGGEDYIQFEAKDIKLRLKDYVQDVNSIKSVTFILTGDYSGIYHPSHDQNDYKCYYSLDGIRKDEPSKGINIRRDNTGSKKVIIN